MWHSWLLRESAGSRGQEVDVGAVLNSAVDSGLPLGGEILRFVDAAVLADGDELPEARGALIDRSGPGTVKAAAGVVATFELMNRLVDAVGIPIDRERFDEFIIELGVTVPDHVPGWS